MPLKHWLSDRKVFSGALSPWINELENKSEIGLLVNPQGQAPTQQGGDAIAAPDVYNPRRLAAELWVGI